jgi:hypothetical protein
MKLDNKKIFETLNPNKVWVPVLIGLGIVFFMFYMDPSVNARTLRGVFDASTPALLLAILFIFFRCFSRDVNSRLWVVNSGFAAIRDAQEVGCLSSLCQSMPALRV